jgi:hypothetical protein
LSGKNDPPSFAKVRFLVEHEPPDRKIEFVEFPVLGGHATNPSEYAEYADIDLPVGNPADPTRPYPDVGHRALPGSYAKLPNGAPSTVLNSDFTLYKLAKDVTGLGAFKPFLADKIHPTEQFARRLIQIAVSTVLTYEEALLPEDQVPIVIVIADGWNHKTRTREAYRDFRRALRNVTTVWEFKKFYALHHDNYYRAAYSERGQWNVGIAANFYGLLYGLHRQMADGGGGITPLAPEHARTQCQTRALYDIQGGVPSYEAGAKIMKVEPSAASSSAASPSGQGAGASGAVPNNPAGPVPGGGSDTPVRPDAGAPLMLVEVVRDQEGQIRELSATGRYEKDALDTDAASALTAV